MRGRVSFPVRWEFRSVPVAPPAGCSLLPRKSEVARLSACELEIMNWKSEAKNFLTWTSGKKRRCARGQSERVHELGVLDRGDYRRHSSDCAACACALPGVCVSCLVACVVLVLVGVHARVLKSSTWVEGAVWRRLSRGRSCVGGVVSKARCRRRGVEGLLVRERVRVDRQCERVVLDNKVEQLGVVLGLSW